MPTNRGTNPCSRCRDATLHASSLYTQHHDGKPQETKTNSPLDFSDCVHLVLIAQPFRPPPCPGRVEVFFRRPVLWSLVVQHLVVAHDAPDPSTVCNSSSPKCDLTLSGRSRFGCRRRRLAGGIWRGRSGVTVRHCVEGVRAVFRRFSRENLNTIYCSYIHFRHHSNSQNKRSGW